MVVYIIYIYVYIYLIYILYIYILYIYIVYISIYCSGGYSSDSAVAAGRWPVPWDRLTVRGYTSMCRNIINYN